MAVDTRPLAQIRRRHQQRRGPALDACVALGHRMTDPPGLADPHCVACGCGLSFDPERAEYVGRARTHHCTQRGQTTFDHADGMPGES